MAVLWLVTVIYSIISILLCCFIVKNCYLVITTHYMDSLLMLFKDPEICAALNMNIEHYQNFSHDSIFKLITSNIKNNKFSTLKYYSKFENLLLNISSDDMSLTLHSLSYRNNTLSHIRNVNRNNDNVCNMVTVTQSTYPVTTTNNKKDLLKVRCHPIPSTTDLETNSCDIMKNIPTCSTNYSINEAFQLPCTSHDSHKK